MKKKYCSIISDAIIESCSQGSKLSTLIWNFDMQKTPSTGKKFLYNLVRINESIRIGHICMTGVFMMKDTRDEIRAMYKKSGIEQKCNYFNKM